MDFVLSGMIPACGAQGGINASPISILSNLSNPLFTQFGMKLRAYLVIMDIAGQKVAENPNG